MALFQRIQSYLLSAHFVLFLMSASFIGVLLIMINTSPIELGPAGMLAAFVIFYIWFFTLFLGGVHVARAFTGRHKEQDERSRTISGRLVMLAAAWAFAPLIMLALQSIGQLEVVSLGLVVVFEVLVSIYIIKR